MFVKSQKVVSAVLKKIKDWFLVKDVSEHSQIDWDRLFPPSIDVHEYDVIILDPSPAEAINELTERRKDGWTVVQVYCENQVILERTKRVYINERKANDASQAS